MKYSQTCSKDHLFIKITCLERPHFTGPQRYTFHVIEPAYRDQLCIRTTFCWSLGWFYIQVSLYQFFLNFANLFSIFRKAKRAENCDLVDISKNFHLVVFMVI